MSFVTSVCNNNWSVSGESAHPDLRPHWAVVLLGAIRYQQLSREFKRQTVKKIAQKLTGTFIGTVLFLS